MTSILGENEAVRFSQPPTAIQRDRLLSPHLEHESNSIEALDHRSVEAGLATDGVHREIDVSKFNTENVSPDTSFRGPDNSSMREKATGTLPPLSKEPSGKLEVTMSASDAKPTLPDKFPPFQSNRPHAHSADDVGQRGQAHDPLEDHLYLFIGPSTFAAPSVNPDRRPSFVPDDDDVPYVSESPGAADIDIYETAYRDEIERIKAMAREEEREEPAVYLTRRVDAQLLALSAKAGRLAAVGEEGLNQFRDFTQFRERKAKVTEVSRALREAAKEEYARKKQEQKEKIEAAKRERAKTKEAEASKIDGRSQSPDREMKPTKSADTGEMEPLQKSTSALSAEWKEKALDKSRRAKTSLMGLMDMMKSKGKSDKGGD
jgi:hypothetical protein